MVARASLRRAPRRMAFAPARVYTRLLHLRTPRLRRVARQNLAMAMPEFTPHRHAQIVAGVFRSIARILVTFNQFPAIRRGQTKSRRRDAAVMAFAASSGRTS